MYVIRPSQRRYRQEYEFAFTLKSIAISLFIQSRAAVGAEIDRKHHPSLVGRVVRLQGLGAGGDGEGGGWDDEVGGEGAAGDLVTFIAVADGLKSRGTGEGVFHFGAEAGSG